ncbi:helix-turn-helix domain-containing protein [Metabacillus sp. KIGAM252]|uniref:Helix-turn-helix domain-containing protein n=1 Tax=Metabacillus flavus TaxID=2823519 RepID=A0ABS5LGC2_9BACI|nr:XRE family transcriptional regulator [Metabacillus flavus]MBS2969629.1 helix-turn-helix domain-containing protein [Metabacillus flavus]
MEAVGKRIREIRRQKGLSLSELAELAGVSKSYLSYIERNVQKNPSLQFLSKISDTLDIEVNVLLGSEHDPKSQLDEEWKTLIEKAVKEGMSKEEFETFQDYIKFTKWKESQEGRDDDN